MATTLPPADWYPDPTQPSTYRYWDGQRWTDHTAPMQAPPPAPDPPAVGPTAPGPPVVAAGRECAELIREAEALCQASAVTGRKLQTRRGAAAGLVRKLHQQTVAAKLNELPLDAIAKASSGRLRLAALEQAGFRSAGQLRGRSAAQLEQLNGVGPQTAQQVVAACARLEQELVRRTGITFDVRTRPADQTAALRALLQVDRDQELVSPAVAALDQHTTGLAALIAAAKPAAKKLTFRFRSKASRDAALESSAMLARLARGPHARALSERLADAVSQSDTVSSWSEAQVWSAFEARPAEIYALVESLAGLATAEATTGGLPEDIVARIEAIELDTSLLKVHLRGYQEFGAKYVLSQRRCLLGDEMGLGKTIEALAVTSHLAATGARHFIVVAPASVLTNWVREVEHRTVLPVHRVHGPDRRVTFGRWEQHGGVAATTYDTLKSLPLPTVSVAAMIVDEAHYAKNPDAQRSQAVQRWAGLAEHVVFMSGTPLENRLEEFCILAGYLQPQVASTMRSQSLFSTDDFRRSAAPVYLRRNQDDVLTELPERIETEEWVELSAADLVHYRNAVASQNLMAVRRAAFMDPAGSSKVGRLVEIMDAASEDGLKVVVFSFFLDVLNAVHERLGADVVGVINGSVPAGQRQAIIDTFTDRPGHAVLLSQIDAGGVGLNIQAASVVIITEPQWKPSTEEQAIARCHRMGQLRPVQVHRLLTVDSVDEGMQALQQRKAADFDAYARGSAVKDATPSAVDITDTEATRVLIDRETERMNALDP